MLSFVLFRWSKSVETHSSLLCVFMAGGAAVASPESRLPCRGGAVLLYRGSHPHSRQGGENSPYCPCAPLKTHVKGELMYPKF